MQIEYTLDAAGGIVELKYSDDTLAAIMAAPEGFHPAFLAATDSRVVAYLAQQTKDAADANAAKAYTKLTTLKAMTPTQVQAWVATNVTNLVQAQDAIATLAIAVSILARRL